MALDYFESLESFYLPDCDPDDPVGTRDAIAEALSEIPGFDVPEPRLDDDELAASPPHVLFGWCYDYDMSIALFAIPVDELSESLAVAMKKVDRKAYAHHELTLGDDFAQAYVRIDAALGLPLVDDYFESFPNTIDAADIDCLSRHRVAYGEEGEDVHFEDGALDRRFVAAYYVCRAQ